MSPFELVLFSVDPALIRSAVGAGVSTVIVDWEFRGKRERQRSADTEINRHTASDLRRARSATTGRVICRINAFGPRTAKEVERAIEEGADELLLPMVRRVDEVVRTLELVGGRCGVGILVETVAACELAPQLGTLPLSRVYVGLNDLAIDRGSRTIFAPLVDGSMEGLRPSFDMPFGFGGLTLPERGDPIPARLLIAEMARLRCEFSFLRRSFHRDIAGRDLHREVRALLDALSDARSASADVLEQSRRRLKPMIERSVAPASLAQ